MANRSTPKEMQMTNAVPDSIASSNDVKELALKELLSGLADLGFGTNIAIDGADAVEAMSSLYTSVVGKLKDTQIQPSVVYSASQDSYWCEAHAYWTDALGDATHFFSDTLGSDFDGSDCNLIPLGDALRTQSEKTASDNPRV
jgi:hypothetical protein